MEILCFHIFIFLPFFSYLILSHYLLGLSDIYQCKPSNGKTPQLKSKDRKPVGHLQIVEVIGDDNSDNSDGDKSDGNNNGDGDGDDSDSDSDGCNDNNYISDDTSGVENDDGDDCNGYNDSDDNNDNI